MVVFHKASVLVLATMMMMMMATRTDASVVAGSNPAVRRLEDRDEGQQQEQQYQDGDYNYNYNEQDQQVEEDAIFVPPSVAHMRYTGCSGSFATFLVCPPSTATGTCSTNRRGCKKYRTELSFFLQTYTTAKQREQQYLCQEADALCGQQGNSGSAASRCYASYGCMDEDMWAVAEQEDWENNYYYDDAANNNNAEGEEGEDQQQQEQQQEQASSGISYSCSSYDGNYYVGPQCVNNKIYQGFFIDYNCMNATKEDVFSTLYGFDLDASYPNQNPIVQSGSACTACGVEEYQGGDYSSYNGNNNNMYNNAYEQAFDNDQMEEVPYHCSILSYAGSRITRVDLSMANVLQDFLSSPIGVGIVVTLVLIAGGLFAARLGSCLAGGGVLRRPGRMKPSSGLIEHNYSAASDDSPPVHPDHNVL